MKDTMSIPKAVADTIAALRHERQPLASRLDAIDLAIENLNRVYGVHGEQPMLIERRRTPKPPKVKPERASANPEAGERRELLVAIIAKAEHGVTASDLRKATPKMSDRDRSNALTVLRVKGQIRRAGNAWMNAA